MDVEHGNTDGQACDLAFGAGGRFERGVEQSDIGGSAAHVEGEDVLDVCCASDAERADDSAGGPGEDGAHGFAGGGLR